MDGLQITRTQTPKQKPQGPLGFGKHFTDHMLIIDYTEGRGWHDARIVPYGPLSLDPATTSLHYGQLIFEGLKAYRAGDKLVMFRPHENMKRMNVSADRLCIPTVDEDFFVKAIAELVKVDADWVPSEPGTSLYIRPFIISTDVFLGVHPSHTYKFITILSPVGSYYEGGLAPVKIYVESKYARSVEGGTGYTKCAGNYAASLKAQAEANQQGYAQVLWLDGVSRQYVDEVGAMNILFVIDGKVVTPDLSSGTILPGITRKSVLELLRSWNIPVEERKVPIQEIADAYDNGTLQEVFGCGTAAVISPVGELKWGDKVMKINDGKIGALSQKLYDTITGIQTGALPDPYGWVYEIQ